MYRKWKNHSVELEEASVKLLRQDAASKEVARGRLSRLKLIEVGNPPLSMESLAAETPRAVVTCSMILVVFFFDLRSSLV